MEDRGQAAARLLLLSVLILSIRSTAAFPNMSMIPLATSSHTFSGTPSTWRSHQIWLSMGERTRLARNF
ncbi:MAG TPA: hypothetical protein DIT03_09740 [Candidatus Accumulibacter sp.]|nr:hypothetical protein [Accumulibacter sp.]